MQHRIGFVAILGIVAFASGCDDGDDASPADAEVPAPAAWAAAFEAEDQGAFLSVWGSGPDSIYTVGGQPEAGVAWRFDGAAWAAVTDLPDVPLINWVHGVGDHVFMACNAGIVLHKQGDGPWERWETGEDQPLWGIWAAAPDDVWAVGGDAARREGADPLLLHYDGAAWSRATLPAVDRPYKALFKVWGTGPDDVHAVGQRGVALRWDGAAWTQALTGTADDLISLWGSGPTDIVAVGGRSNGVLARWDGAGWSSEVLVGEPGMNGVWVDAAGTAWLVGDKGRVLRVPQGSFEVAREDSGTRTLLHGVWGTAAGHRVAAGGTLSASPPWAGVVIEVGR